MQKKGKKIFFKVQRSSILLIITAIFAILSASCSTKAKENDIAVTGDPGTLLERAVDWGK